MQNFKMGNVRAWIQKFLFVNAVVLGCSNMLYTNEIQMYQRDGTLDSQSSEINKDENNKVKTYNPIEIYAKNTYEFGIGYIGGSFNAIQSIGSTADRTTGFAHGVDAFFNFNHYVNSRGGIYFGVGLELMNISWDDPLLYVVYSSSFSSSDFLYATYWQLGGFYDVYKNRDKSLRIFGGIGISMDLIFGGQYQRKASTSLGYYYNTNSGLYDFENSTISFSFPLMIGARYNFAKRHGVDLFIKYHGLSSWEFSNNAVTLNQNITTLYTDITRYASVGVRYVYEWR